MTTDLTARGTNIDPLTLIEQADLADSTKEKYRRALGGYLATGGSLADAEALAAYAESLSKSGGAFLKAAVKLWTTRMETAFKGRATPENVSAVQAALYLPPGRAERGDRGQAGQRHEGPHLAEPEAG
jgi:hypothetical protein